jgi:hypothetical protein
MEELHANRSPRSGFWETFSAALAVLARRSGCSFSESPLPEIREAVRDFTEWSQASGAETH